MDLTTYTGLQAAISSFLNRADLTSQVPAFIALAEARFNRLLRTPDMTKRSTTTISAEYVDLPNDWLQAISIRVSSVIGYQALEYLSAELFYDKQAQVMTGPPQFYTLVNNRIHLLPAPPADTSLEMTYFAKITPLSGTVASNWLLARSPDLYLYASLVAAEAYLINDERLPVWKGATDEIIADIKLEGERAARPSGALLMKKRSFG